MQVPQTSALSLPAHIRITRQHAAYYGIQDPHTGLYARVKDEPPAKPEPAEEAQGAVTARHGHVRFTAWTTATWFRSLAQAQAAFAHYFGAAALEIVRRDS